VGTLHIQTITTSLFLLTYCGKNRILKRESIDFKQKGMMGGGVAQWQITRVACGKPCTAKKKKKSRGGKITKFLYLLMSRSSCISATNAL
jgi:RNase H-fold protein (predicted Holliday junction resolvase)